jgi:predicted O-methyltransferase YrrM
MTPDEIMAVVKDTPVTSVQRGLEIYGFIRKHRLTRALELGFAHGVGTIWIGGAMRSLGGGSVVAVDDASALERTPNARDLIAKAALESMVTLSFEPLGYTWHLKREMAHYQADPFDFVFIDGAHTWDTDGFAFFLVERILKPGGWILFDDLKWTFASSPALRNLPSTRAMHPEARDHPQIQAVWEQLVLPHPGFCEATTDGNWGWVKKKKG